MKRIWLVFLLVYTSNSGAVEPKAVLCEAEMSPRSQAVLNLMKSSLALGLVSVRDLRAFAVEEDQSLPLSKKVKDITNLDIGKGVKRLYAKLSAPEKRRVHSALRSELEKLAIEKSLIDEASQGQRSVLVAKLSRQLKSSLKIISSSGELASGQLHGRPVFYGVFYAGVSGDLFDFHYLLLDPTNPVKSEQVRKLYTESIGSGNPRFQKPVIVELNGKVYATAIDGKLAFDLTTLKPVLRSEIGIADIISESLWSDVLIVETSRGKKLLAGLNNPSALAETDLGRSAAHARRVIEGLYQNLRENNVDGRTLISFASRKGEIFSYAIEEGSVLEKVYSAPEERLVQYPILFRDQNADQIVFFEHPDVGAQFGPMRIGILDRKTKYVEYLEETHEVKDGVHFYRTPMGPRIAFFDRELRLVVVDLRTRKTEIREVRGIMGFPKPMTWKSAYWTWVTKDRGLAFYDLNEDQLTLVHDLHIQARQIQHFEYQGQKLALVTPDYGLPYVMQVVSEVERKVGP